VPSRSSRPLLYGALLAHSDPVLVPSSVSRSMCERGSSCFRFERVIPLRAHHSRFGFQVFTRRVTDFYLLKYQIPSVPLEYAARRPTMAIAYRVDSSGLTTVPAVRRMYRLHCCELKI
jgi:hypothetical protein